MNVHTEVPSRSLWGSTFMQNNVADSRLSLRESSVQVVAYRSAEVASRLSPFAPRKLRSALIKIYATFAERKATISERKATIAFLFLLIALSRPLYAQNTSPSVAIVEAHTEFLIDKTETFARPVGTYTYLAYDQVVPNNLGWMSQEFKQKLPVAGGRLTKAVPSSEPTFRRNDSDRVPQTFGLFRPGKSIVVTGNKVMLYDRVTDQENILIDGPDVTELQFATKFARTALSPNGRQLVAAILRVEDYNGFSDFPLYDIYVVDLFIPVVSFPKTLDQIQSGDQYKPKLVGEAIRGYFSIGSAFHSRAIAPPLFWADDEHVIFMTPKEQPLDAGGTLVGINVKSQHLHEYFELMLDRKGWGEQSAEFWRRSDGAIMLRNDGKDFRIDLQKRAAIEDRRLSPRYELRGDRYTPSLWSGEELLCDSLYYRNVGVSPDGQCVAWYARSEKVRDKTNLGNTSQYLTTLWFYSPETGKVELAEGKFFGQDHPYQFDNPQLSTSFRWLSGAE
jgi:hypothetical protein